MQCGWTGTSIFLTARGRRTTYECLISPIRGWEGRENKPVAQGQFGMAGVEFERLMDAALNLCATGSLRPLALDGVLK